MVTCCNDNLEDDIPQPSADKIVFMPKIIHHVVTVEAKSSFHLHDILVIILLIILLSLFQVVKQGITKTAAHELPAPLPLLCSLFYHFHYLSTLFSKRVRNGTADL